MPGARIGVTGPDRGGTAAWLMTALAVRRCGGVPVRISASRGYDEDSLDGLVIGGGTDVDPFHYGQEKLAENAEGDGDAASSLLDWVVGAGVSLMRLVLSTSQSQDYDPDRDELEQHLVRYALYNDLPILGICRGAQLMNVVLGGSLHQSIEHYYSEGTRNIRSVLPRKSIDVTPGSRLGQVLGAEKCRVNALHDQSIDALGEGLVVSAREHHGVVQAIEKTGREFFVGVQWHPEYMPQSAPQVALFRHLVRGAAGT